MKKYLGLLLLSTICLAQPAITTKSYDNARTNANNQETILTPSLLLTRGIRKMPSIPLYGDARGMEAQPLVLPGVKLADGSVHDIMILANMANVIRAVNAKDGSSIWQITLGTPITGSSVIDMHQINQHWGCLSTGVIDPDTARLYQVCWISIDNSGTPQSGRYFMHVIDIKTGALVVPPVPIQGTDTSMWKQRSSLVMTTVNGIKTVFMAHGSVYETVDGYTGGITAFDVATNKISTNLPLPEGIWMAGQGLVADKDGFLYAITGNGAFDPSKGWFGESFIKVQYAKNVLKVIDQWSPWTDFQRTGTIPKAAPKLAGDSAPSEALTPVGGNMKMSPMTNAKLVAKVDDTGQPVTLVYPSMAKGAWADEDWGSAGPACIFSISVCVATGKDGIAYPIRSNILGGTTTATVGTATNYAKLAARCAWVTMSPGNIPCDPADATILNFFPNGLTAHLHMTPVQYYDPALKTWTLFYWGENARLHKWAISNTGKLKYITEGLEYASISSRARVPGGMAGGFCTLSSNNGQIGTAIIWCSIPIGDANRTVTQGRLLAYDASNLQVVWDSQRWGLNFVYNKFMPPTIWNGQVYLPNYDGSVDIYAP